MTVCPRHVSTRNASWSKYHLVHAAWPYKHMANLRHVNDFKRYPTGRRMYYDSDARFNRMYAKTQVEALQAAFETRQRSRILAIMPDAQRVFDITDRLRQSPAIDGDLQQRYRDILSSDTVSRLEAESLLATATIRPRQQTVLQSADATVITRQLTQEAWTATSRSPAAERFKELYACCLHALDKQARYEALQRYHTVRYGDEGRRSFNAVWDRDHATYQGHKLDSRDITYRTDLLSEQHSMLRDYCVEQQGGTVEMLANETPERQSWSDLRPSEIALIYKHYYVLK
ncbi:hypothetical protein E5Q_01901 [Mixia osmundae IAM 14324]|uniref:Uncharacterized protein n=2 Tax=Mixia osmundae (strain CBS 9802 / IAM 14324 / JCM 22182 / KY 12970) TaxID=764103 RepID=G7DXD5_MIXOS|nr:hypothetical protein E5Q_01901 [Mixia osmundae IAM 14324]